MMSLRRISLLPRYCSHRISEPKEAFVITVVCPSGHRFSAKYRQRYFCEQCGIFYSDKQMIENGANEIETGRKKRKVASGRRIQRSKGKQGGSKKS